MRREKVSKRYYRKYLTLDAIDSAEVVSLVYNELGLMIMGCSVHKVNWSNAGDSYKVGADAVQTEFDVWENKDF